MKPVPTKTRRSVRYMRDPRPQFVSLVGRGANMTPIRVIKEDPDMLVAAWKDSGHVVVRFGFRGEGWSGAAGEAAVRAWLDKGGYAGTVLKAAPAGDGWDVSAEQPAEIEGEAETVELEQGVTVTVGKRAGVVPPAGTTQEPAAPVEPAPAPAEPAGAGTAAKGEAKGEGGGGTEAGAVQPVATPAPSAPTPAPVARSTYHVGELASLIKALGWMAEDLGYEDGNETIISVIKNAAGTLVGVLGTLAAAETDKLAEWLAKKADAAPEPAPALRSDLDGLADRVVAGVAERVVAEIKALVGTAQEPAKGPAGTVPEPVVPGPAAKAEAAPAAPAPPREAAARRSVEVEEAVVDHDAAYRTRKIEQGPDFRAFRGALGL